MELNYVMPMLMDHTMPAYPPMVDMGCGEKGLFSPFEPTQIYPFDAKYFSTEE
jgi:hypothetical protein